ncbi:MAG: bile acid:sodium symporter family protein [Candidatus Ozemobacteraceae bacterium]
MITGLEFNRSFDRHMFLFLLAAMGVGGFLGEHLAPYRNLVPWLFAYMTFTTSLQCSWHEFLHVARKPGPVLMILGILHIVLPAVAIVCGRACYPENPDLVAGFVLAAAIPIGVTSAIWTGLAAGEVPLALSAITIDTLLSPLVTPLVLLIFLGRTVTLDMSALMIDLTQMIVFPAMLGLTLHDLSGGGLYKVAVPYLGPPSRICLAMVIAINLATVRHVILGASINLPLLLVFTEFVVILGFVLGQLGPRLIGCSRARTTAVIYSVGIRNLSAGLIIAADHFPALTILPLVLAMLFQQPTAALAHRFLSRHSPD